MDDLSRINQLADDVLLDIFRRAPHATLFSLCLVSQRLRHLCTPLLYAHVNLTTHHRGVIKYDRNVLPELYGDSIPQPDPPDEYKQDIARRQRVFLATLDARSELAKLVRNFSWTLLFGPLKDDGDDWYGCVDEEWDGPMTYPDTKTWEIFQTLTHVRTLDLGSFHFRMTRSYIRDCPRRLFSTATSITLAGWMNQELADAVLCSIDPTTLSSLALDNVQHWGQHRDGSLFQNSYKVQDFIRNEPGFISPGPMRGLLRSLTNRCVTLTRLHLRKATSSSSFGRMPELSLEADTNVYREWAAFLKSVETTLRYLVLEHGEAAPRAMLPDGQNFLQHILPVLQRNTWPALQHLEVRGISDDMAIMIKAVVRPQTTVILAPTLRKPVYVWSGTY
ncbi:MAG: hypothetical protein M1817_004655 [Caeruleum heppii]|nr:MAG: hypothetical protein M1817_004655 [Caeruleum heppii]